MVPTIVPLSSRSGRKSATALAIRASERLSPSVMARRKKEQKEPSNDEIGGLIGRKASELWKTGKNLLHREDPLPFPGLVREELLNMLADEGLVSEAAKHADPEIQEALRKAHFAAETAIAAGGGWVAFAAIVGNAGFLPYILAAKLSAWVPLVGGPALVSLLATLVIPVTVVVGVGALGWLAMGKGSRVVRSQVAARICALLVLPGSEDSERGLSDFVSEMRTLDREPTSSFEHLSKAEKSSLRTRLGEVSHHFLSAIPKPAGSPPRPWNQKHLNSDLTDTAIVASLTVSSGCACCPPRLFIWLKQAFRWTRSLSILVTQILGSRRPLMHAIVRSICVKQPVRWSSTSAQVQRTSDYCLTNNKGALGRLVLLVGVRGFEPPTPASRRQLQSGKAPKSR